MPFWNIFWGKQDFLGLYMFDSYVVVVNIPSPEVTILAFLRRLILGRLNLEKNICFKFIYFTVQ